MLTKALGTGTITTALKNGQASDADVDAAVASMLRLNRDAARAARAYRVHAMTDVTGYSLLGHAHEMAHLSGVRVDINYAALRWLPGALGYGEQEIFPGGMWRNHEFYSKWVRFEAELKEFQQYLLYDPQTSGGLLIALLPDDARSYCEAVAGAAIIGEVKPGEAGAVVVRD